jgi:hypothetical protein
MQSIPVFRENGMISGLLNKEKMKEAIVRKGNLSVPDLDKLTYPILKYEKDDATNLLVSIINMMLRVQKCPQAWKDGKVAMFPKPCNEDGKDRPENWGPITLTGIFYRIIFRRIADYFQAMNEIKRANGNGIVCKE